MFDFDKLTERRKGNSLKWDIAENELPMWVADMDFETAPAVKDVLVRRAMEGIFGYAVVTDEWYDAIINWWKERYNYSIDKNWLQFCTGTLAAIGCAIRRLTNTGDNIVVQTPVYNIFFNSIVNNGRNILENKLSYNKNEYSIDFNDLEEKLKDPLTTMMILCNPHNPSGNIWSREELEKIGELCYKYNVIVISDEVHCDLTDPGHRYVPFGSVSEICRNISITCISVSKTFNLAGLHSAAVIVPDERLRNIMIRGLNSDEVAEPGSFAVEGSVAAYTKGGEWVDSLREYIYENKKAVREFIKSELPDISVTKSEATYLLWLDCSKITENVSKLSGYVRSETGLYLTDGTSYRGNGNKFMRMNTASQRVRINDGLERLKNGVRGYVNIH